jgi:hypothetical protein
MLTMAAALSCAYTFLQVNGLLQTTQTLLGRFSFFTPRVMRAALPF